MTQEYDEWNDDDHDSYCEHEDYDIDVCTGRASCYCCDHHWYLSGEEIDAELERQATYREECAREDRRQWWRDRTFPVRMFVFRILERIWPRKACRVLYDDEIPF